MPLLTQLLLAIKSYQLSFNFINTHKLWGWFVIPAILNLLLFLGLGWIAWVYSDEASNYLVQFFSISDESTASIIFWVVLIFIRVFITLLFILIYKYTVLILFAPVLALFAEKLFTVQTGRDIPFDFKTFLNNVFRGVVIAIKNLIKELILTLLVSLLSFTGVLAPVVPVLVFMVQSYYYGFSMMDYRCELMGLNVKDSSKYVWKNKGIALGNGAVFEMILLVPFIGVLIGPMLSLVAAFITMENKNPDSL